MFCALNMYDFLMTQYENFIGVSRLVLIPYERGKTVVVSSRFHSGSEMASH